MMKSWKKKNSTKHHGHISNDHERFCKMSDTERVVEYLRLAKEGWDHAWQIYHHDDWKLAAGKDLESGCVYTKHDTDGRKIFKLDGLVDAAPIEVFNQLVHGDNESPAWNPTVLMCKTVQSLNDNTDVAYNVSSPGAGGLVSSRDFVNLRHWKTQGELTLSLGLSTCHPDIPPGHKYVRAENKPAAWVFKPMDKGEKCHFTLILKTDLKGWLPHYLVDQAMTGCLVHYIKYLRDRMHDLKHNNAINSSPSKTKSLADDHGDFTATNGLVKKGCNLSRSASDASFQSCDSDMINANGEKTEDSDDIDAIKKLEELDLDDCSFVSR